MQQASNKRFWFASSRIRNLYIYYVLALLVLVLGFGFVMFSYSHLQRAQLSPLQLSDRSVALIAAAQNLPKKERMLLLKGEMRRGLHVNYSHKPAPAATVINVGDIAAVRQQIMQQPQNFNMSVGLGQNIWLNIRHHPNFKGLLFDSFVMLGALLLLAIAALLYSFVRRVAFPLQDFVRASQRFAVDMQAPPMALSGPLELRQAVIAFNNMQAQVRRLVGDRTQMLAAISHDLRTPITRLQLRAEAMPDSQREKAIADLQEMEQMINSILSFARDYSQQENISRFDLGALLDTICNDLQDAGRKVELLETDDMHSQMAISGRMLALKRALTNLIENAVKYGARAIVSMQTDDAGWQIKIKDQGPGIDEVELEKVFRPFYRVDAARTSGKGGSGLGLAVARDIVRAHGGEIKLRNLPTGGLQVTVSLPRDDD